MARRTIIVVLIVACTTFASLFLYLSLTSLIPQESQESRDLQWGVNIGDEFVFHVDAAFHRSGSMSLPEDRRKENASKHLDLTRVRATIIDLPSIPQIFDNNSFFETIILANKVGCIFDNGTPIPEEFEVYLSSLISLSILPIGSWEYLDSLYPNTYERLQGNDPPELFDKDYAITRMEERFFYLGIFDPLLNWPNAGEISKEGWLNMTTGFPQITFFRDWEPWCTIQTTFTLNLTLLV
jgi:hypothetical protein